MESLHLRISLTASKVATGTLFGLAVLSAVTRTCIRVRKFHRVLVDDYFLFLAVILLTASTGLYYTDIDYMYTQANVEAGAMTPPANLLQQMIQNEKVQYAWIVMEWLAIYSVKFSFLFFFRGLVRRVPKLIIWWWCVLAVLAPATLACMCSDFMVCPYFGPIVLEKCGSEIALARGNSVLQAVTVIDIVTDVMLISIPITLLRRVKIGFRRKFCLGAVLCASIFMIIISIIKVAAGNLKNGQVDSAWTMFWARTEASVAVIMVSLSAFRSLFVSENPKPTVKMQRIPYTMDRLISTTDPFNKYPRIPSVVLPTSRLLDQENTWARQDSSHSIGIAVPLKGPEMGLTYQSFTHDGTSENASTPYRSLV